PTDPDESTKAAGFFEILSGLAYHTLLLTGTPDRSDRSPLVLAKYSDPNEKGIKLLEYHVRATYLEGVAQGHLRPMQFNLHDGEGSFADAEEFTISELEKSLGEVLKKDGVWQPLADSVVNELRKLRRLS